MTTKRKVQSVAETKLRIETMIVGKSRTLEAALNRYLESNARRDRDALIKKRTEIHTLKQLKNELF